MDCSSWALTSTVSWSLLKGMFTESVILPFHRLLCCPLNLVNPSVQFSSVQFSSVTQSYLTLCDPHGLQHARPPWPSTTPGVYSNSCSLSQQCDPIILSSVIPFSSHLQTFPAIESFQMSQFFSSGGQSIAVSVSPSVLPTDIQD